MAEIESLTMLSDIADLTQVDDLYSQLTEAYLESPISVLSTMNSPRKSQKSAEGQITFDSSHRLAVVTIEEITSSPPRINKRKQSSPHRSIRQLTSLAEKMINGIVVVEPRFSSGEEDDYENKINLLPTILLSTPQAKKPRTQNSTGGRSSRRRDRDTRMPSPESESSGRSPSPTARQTTPVSPDKNPNSKPAAMIGRHLQEDFDPEQLAIRSELYLNIYRKRKSPGSMALLGTNRLSGFGGTPLDISGAPGASLLSEQEFELCSLLRLQPLQYFQSRDTLLRNYRERGFYRKSAAQKMLHIDVNKTGRLYDFFVKMAWMPETESADAAALVQEPAYIDWEQLLP